MEYSYCVGDGRLAAAGSFGAEAKASRPHPSTGDASAATLDERGLDG